MNAEEALRLCRIAKGAFPATNMDEFTPEAWSLALEDERIEDALLALKGLMREQTFIHVSDIVQRVKRIRNDRVLAFGVLPSPPVELADDPAADAAWSAALRKRIADGDLVDLPPAIEAPSTDHKAKRDAILANRFQEVTAE